VEFVCLFSLSRHRWLYLWQRQKYMLRGVYAKSWLVFRQCRMSQSTSASTSCCHQQWYETDSRGELPSGWGHIQLQQVFIRTWLRYVRVSAVAIPSVVCRL